MSKKRLLQFSPNYALFFSDVALRLALFFAWQQGLPDFLFWLLQIIGVSGFSTIWVFQVDAKLKEKYGEHEPEYVQTGPLFLLTILITFLGAYLSYGMYDFGIGKLPFAIFMFVIYGIYMFLLWAASHLNFVADISDQQVDTQAKILNESDIQAQNSKLDQALAYQRQIETLLKQKQNPFNEQRLQDIQAQLNKSIAAMRALNERTIFFQRNALLQADFEVVPQAIEQLRAQLKAENNPATQAKLKEAIDKRQAQLENLDALQELMEQAEIDIDHTLSIIGTIYTQLMVEQSTHQAADYQYLSEDMEEQLNVLRDQLEALKDVKFNQL